MITIQGKGVSAGVGVGPLYFYRRATAEIKRYTVEDTDAEWHRFKGAQTGAIEQLGVLAEQARKEAGDEAAMLFETHQMMAEDLDFEEAIEDRIVNQKMNAEAAVSDTSEQFAEMFASMDDAYMQARAADVKDVSQRILGILCGIVWMIGSVVSKTQEDWIAEARQEDAWVKYAQQDDPWSRGPEDPASSQTPTPSSAPREANDPAGRTWKH